MIGRVFVRVSIELVPRDIEHLENELQIVKSYFESINMVNIPDLMTLKMRSWEAASVSKQYYEHSIPHIRSIDFNLQEDIVITEYLMKNSITEILVVTGDRPQDMSRKVYPTSSVDFIKRLKIICPQLKVYAAMDPYRDNLRQECDYIQRKLEAGADGFFTQPFFDTRFMEIYFELLDGLEVFWGVSPVISDKSISYWESKNNVVFPKNFEPTLEWNVDFAKKALEFTKIRKSNIYFMPIKVDLRTYLEAIFNVSNSK
jgi:methylenetetrahydrofolate reductase (NADPH)